MSFLSDELTAILGFIIAFVKKLVGLSFIISLALNATCILIKKKIQSLLSEGNNNHFEAALIFRDLAIFLFLKISITREAEWVLLSFALPIKCYWIYKLILLIPETVYLTSLFILSGPSLYMGFHIKLT